MVVFFLKVILVDKKESVHALNLLISVFKIIYFASFLPKNSAKLSFFNEIRVKEILEKIFLERVDQERLRRSDA